MAAAKRKKAVAESGRSAKAFIAAHQERLQRQRTANLPSEEALADLEELMAYSDSLPVRDRVTTAEAIALLAEHGWVRERSSFDRFMVEHYGRKWSGKR